MNFRVGSFAASTTTGNQSVTGIGFQAKAVLFWGNKQTADGTTTGAELFLGAATSSTQRWALWQAASSNGTTSNAHRIRESAACIEIRDLPATPTNASVANGRADFVSFDADGFTINWSDAPSAAYIIHYAVWGGAAITNAKAGQFNAPGASGNQTITDPGFQPGFVMLAAVANSAEGTSNDLDIVHSALTLGFAAGSNQYTLAYLTENNRTVFDDYRYQSSARMWTTLDNQADADVATFVGFTSSGWTMNWSNLPGTDPIFYLALAGGSYAVGTYTTQTTTGTFDAVTGLSFVPAGVLNFTTFSANSVHTAEAYMMLGGASSSTARAALENSSLENKSINQRLDRTRIYTNLTAGGTPTLNGDIDFVDFSPSTGKGFRLNQTDADPSAVQVGYVAFGPSPTRGLISWTELESPLAPTRGQISWAEFESPFVPTRGRVSWTELETPFAPTRGRISWTELESPLAPTRGLISWTELESPLAPTRGLISWTELEVPALGATRGLVSWTELETPFAPTRGQLSWTELEVPALGATRGLISWAELETLLAPTRGRISWAELQADIAPTRGLISWIELESPFAPTRGRISWAEFFIADPGTGRTGYPSGYGFDFNYGQ